MNNLAKIAIISVLITAVGMAVALKQNRDKNSVLESLESVERLTTLPRLVELGMTTCIPCKTMMPIIEALKKDCDGQLIVEFINLKNRPEAEELFRVRTIPLQVFIGPSGQELFRHEGVFTREQILTKWEELGYKIEPLGNSELEKDA